MQKAIKRYFPVLDVYKRQDFHDPSGQECGYFDGRRMPERGRTYECFV